MCVCVTHVHVHPDVVLSADVRDGDEWVEGAVYCGTSGGAHKERHKTLQKNKQKTERVMKFFFFSV